MLTSLALAATAAIAGPSTSPLVAPLAVAGLELGNADSGLVTLEAAAPAPSAECTVGLVGGSDPKDASTAKAEAKTAPKLPEAAAPVSFQTRDSQLLSASFYAPKRKKKGNPAPAALLLHDAGSTRNDLETLGAYLHKKGYAVLTVDLRGHGASATEEISFEKADEKGKQTLWNLSSRDVDAAVTFLQGQDGVHGSNLSLFGVGAGASLAVRRATDDDSVRAVVLIDPKVDAFGFDLTAGLADLGGLPTLLVAPKDNKKVAKTLQTQAHEANAGMEYVSISNLKKKAAEKFADSKLNSGTTSWLKGHVSPSK